MHSKTHQQTAEQPAPVLDDVLRQVRLVVFDVDGTLTDGSLTIGEAGESKVFNVLDGAGIKWLISAGLEVGFITSRTSTAVARRAGELGVKHLIQGAEAKGAALIELQDKLGVRPKQTAAMGDDLPDLAMFRRSAIGLAPVDAAPEVLAAAGWISQRPAGRGAAREACELVLKAQARWARIVAAYQD